MREDHERDHATIVADHTSNARAIDFDARAERVKAIVEAYFGRVTAREGDIVKVEVPADVSIGLNAHWGMAGFVATVEGQTTRLASRFDRLRPHVPLWPIATESHVSWNVGDQGKSGPVVLNVSFVVRDPEPT